MKKINKNQKKCFSFDFQYFHLDCNVPCARLGRNYIPCRLIGFIICKQCYGGFSRNVGIVH